MNNLLSTKYRPSKLNEIIGQDHLIGSNKILTNMLEKKQLLSMILYGNSGCGKTTIALALINELQLPYKMINATSTNKKELDTIFMESKMYPTLILVIDEIHRLNKDKQDLLLPKLEDGSIVLIGLTTSNPFFAINPAIRSRVILLEVKKINNDDIIQQINRVVNESDYQIEENCTKFIANHSNGDLRTAYNLLQAGMINAKNNIIHSQDIEEICSVGNLNLFKDDDDYYNLLSAFQKSIRGSDVQASIYYLAMLLLSNDLESLIRRLLVIAYEDIGLANPNLVTKTMMACDSAIKVGMPECRIIFSNIVIDLALSPKSKSAEMAIDKAMSLVSSNPLPIPDYLHLVNISLQNADKYDYDNFESWNQIQYLPNNIKDIEFYLPIDSSPYETILKQNYQKLRQIKRTTNLRSLKK